MKKLIYSIPIVLVLLLALPVTALAAPLDDGRVVIGSDYVLASGETLDGDLVVLGGTAVLEADSMVDGNVFVMGGNLDADGYIDGDLAIMGGNASLGPNAVVEGDVVTLGGNVDPGLAMIRGQIMSEQVFDFPMDFNYARGFRPSTDFNAFQGFGMGMGGRILWYFFQAFLLAALAALVVVFIPEHTKRVASVLTEQPWLSGGIGILTMIVAPILIIFLFITICLALLGFLGVFILVVAGVFGWIAVGMEVGDRLAMSLDREWQPVLAAAVGTLIVTLVLNGIGFIPCIGWLAPFLIGAVGLGAVILTRFGTRDYISGGAGTELAKKPASKTTKSS